jgi:protein-disulfide isomerase
MKSARAVVSLGFVLAALLSAVPTAAQQESEELRKDIEAIKEGLKGIQKDIQEIKALIARQAPPPSGIGVVLDLASNAAKGERTAKLTMVEFSDYQ